MDRWSETEKPTDWTEADCWFNQIDLWYQPEWWTLINIWNLESWSELFRKKYQDGVFNIFIGHRSQRVICQWSQHNKFIITSLGQSFSWTTQSNERARILAANRCSKNFRCTWTGAKLTGYLWSHVGAKNPWIYWEPLHHGSTEDKTARSTSKLSFEIHKN